VHVIKQHPELASMIDDVLDIVTRPDVITPDPEASRWRYWRAGVGPTRWVGVVVVWSASPPFIITAFPSGRQEPW
jgi:hypothetical protein